MSQRCHQPRVALVTNIYAPYRAPVFAALAEMVDLHVIYCAFAGAGGMRWHQENLPYSHSFVNGLRLQGRVKRTDGRENRRAEYHVSPRILAAIRRHEPDAIMVGGYSFPSFYAWAYSTATGVRRIIVSETTTDTERGLSSMQLAARRLLLRKVDCAVGNSEAAAARLRGLGVPGSRVHQSGFTTDIVAIDPSSRASHEGCRFLSVGRLVQTKGVDYLLRAFAAVLTTTTDVELTIVGEGPEEANLRQLARDLNVDSRVRFAGFKNRSTLPMEYARADVFVFPTIHDPFGVVLVEAAAAGLPLIASRHAGATPELIDGGKAGRSIEPMRTESMAEAMADLANCPELRLEMGAAARRAAMERTPQRAALDLHSAIMHALREPR